MAATERFDIDVSPERAWLATFAAAVVAFAAGAVALPRLVWDRFLWHYFWGPVFADAQGARCAVMTDSGPDLLFRETRCSAARNAGSIVAEPGYTLVSEAGYAITLIFFLIGVLYLLRYLEVGESLDLFFALTPFMFFGGALRVVEDANNAALEAGVESLLSYPANTLIISPVIYFTVFAVTLAVLVAGVALDRREVVESYHRFVFAVGSLVLLATAGFLFWFVPTQIAPEIPGVGFYPLMTIVTLVLAAVLAVVIYAGAERYAPVINEGTGRAGLVVLFGHAVDGVANVLSADWLDYIGVPVEYGSKHPVNRIIVDITQSVQPEWLSTAIGTSWPFLAVKLIAATAVIYVFDRRIFEESPRYAVLLLVAILAVGLGPGSRDMLRATFGI
ncbi:DUF63 family protein [Haloglomus salinum]|jgi:uncharacterized membrane protein|uniref:DUF63 family protein n=1 Tax=Haloglomus salinum TaxID=2962673 RepID=UPI0020C9AF16|nr:DUF63 family protein [Haloglomus salinum]